MARDPNWRRTHYLKERPGTRRIRAFFRAYRMEIRQNKKTFFVYTMLRILIVFCIIREAVRGNFESVFMAAMTLLLLTVPAILQIQFRVDIPQLLEIIILLFIYSAEILGEINEYYTKIPFWDTILHTLNGFLAAAVGFSLVLVLNKKENVVFELSPIYLVIVAFCFSMTIGVCWEFIEFTCDHLFGLDMQKDTIVHMISSTKLNPNGQKPVKIYHIHQVIVNGKDLGLGGYLDIGLIDTMKDLFVNFIGALVFSVIGFFALHGRKKSMEISEKFIIHRKGEETDYLAQMKDQQKVQEALGRMDEEAGVDEKLESRKKRLEEWESRLLAWEKQLELNDLEAAKALKKSLHSDENAASSGLSDVPEDGEKPLTAEFEKPLQSEKSLQKEKDINGKKS